MAPKSLLDALNARSPAALVEPIASRKSAAALARLAGVPCPDFLLVLVDAQLHLLNLYRLPRAGEGVQNFPLGAAVRLAIEAQAEGMIVIQEREADPVPRRPDLELTSSLQRALEETGIGLVDHLLVCGELITSAGGLSLPKTALRKTGSP